MSYLNVIMEMVSTFRISFEMTHLAVWLDMAMTQTPRLSWQELEGDIGAEPS